MNSVLSVSFIPFFVVPSVLSANSQRGLEGRGTQNGIPAHCSQGFRRFSAESTDLDKGHCFQCRLVQSSDPKSTFWNGGLQGIESFIEMN